MAMPRSSWPAGAPASIRTAPPATKHSKACRTRTPHSGRLVKLAQGAGFGE
jgi:hypothetical protein